MEYMTIKELADYCEVSEITIRRIVKEVFPEVIKNGIQTKLTKEQVTEVMKARQVDSRGEQVNNEVAEMKQMFMMFMKHQQKMDNVIIEIMNNQNKQLLLPETNQLTVSEYCKQNNITDFNMRSFKQKVGKECTSMSRKLKRSIGFKDDGDFTSGAYDPEIIQHSVKLIKLIKMMTDKTNELF